LKQKFGSEVRKRPQFIHTVNQKKLVIKKIIKLYSSIE